jgi:hypothetical protein
VNTTIIDVDSVKIAAFSDSAAPAWAQNLFDALNRCTPNQAGRRRVVLPYQIQTMADLPERAVVLNRWYKPLGMPNGSDYTIPYEEHPEAHIHVELYNLAKPLLNAAGYFFKDNSAPWISTENLRAYREKIKDLLAPWIEPGTWS